jgi:hypothetical protein
VRKREGEREREREREGRTNVSVYSNVRAKIEEREREREGERGCTAELLRRLSVISKVLSCSLMSLARAAGRQLWQLLSRLLWSRAAPSRAAAATACSGALSLQQLIAELQLKGGRQREGHSGSLPLVHLCSPEHIAAMLRLMHQEAGVHVGPEDLSAVAQAACKEAEQQVPTEARAQPAAAAELIGH